MDHTAFSGHIKSAHRGETNSRSDPQKGTFKGSKSAHFSKSAYRPKSKKVHIWSVSNI